MVTAISRAEINIKVSVGKLHLPVPESVFWDELISRLQATQLSFDTAHAARLASLPLYHRDPFDRMILAQCLVEDLVLATTDIMLGSYGVTVVN
ncbi:PilT protein domain-containing protein [Fimbriimonas ginsengisoli Gsoil 348]|uniref:PilT protein domain-containing protein n=2 Tax=Fimbriimonas ginsengisoli TaxID=1005039 RepID=A0A068NNU6_FIMGI|nr:PilT protein domain-containing protein [Fimbriimonas ginsengisoli Gsoil 348]